MHTQNEFRKPRGLYEDEIGGNVLATLLATAFAYGQDQSTPSQDKPGVSDAMKGAAKTTAKDTKKGAKTAAKDTEKAADKTGSATKTAAKTTGHAAKTAGKDTEKGTKTAAKDTAKGTKTAAKDTEKAADKTGHATASAKKTGHGVKKVAKDVTKSRERHSDKTADAAELSQRHRTTRIQKSREASERIRAPHVRFASLCPRRDARASSFRIAFFMPTGSEIRRKFLDFFVQKGHREVHSSSLVPAERSHAAVHQRRHEPVQGRLSRTRKARLQTKPRLRRSACAPAASTTIWKTSASPTAITRFLRCWATFRFGDYFKKDAIAYAWELITSPQWFGIAKDKLYVTIFNGEGGVPRDAEAYDLWARAGRSEESHL